MISGQNDFALFGFAFIRRAEKKNISDHFVVFPPFHATSYRALENRNVDVNWDNVSKRDFDRKSAGHKRSRAARDLYRGPGSGARQQ